MSTLQAAAEIRGVTTTVSVLEYTIHVQEKSDASGIVWETGNQGTVPITTPGALYIVPASTSAIVDEMVIFNTSAVTQSVLLYRRVGGTNYTWFQCQLLENESAHYVRGVGWSVRDSVGLLKTESARAGTVFPVAPSFDGQPFYRTDLSWDFNWDAGRSKWLGDVQDYQHGRAGTVANNVELRFGGNLIANASANRGVIIPYDITVVGMAFSNQTSVSGSVNFYRSAVLIAGLTTILQTHLIDMTLNADAAMSTSNTTTTEVIWQSISHSLLDPHCIVYYRRHAT